MRLIALILIAMLGFLCTYAHARREAAEPIPASVSAPGRSPRIAMPKAGETPEPMCHDDVMARLAQPGHGRTGSIRSALPLDPDGQAVYCWRDVADQPAWIAPSASFSAAAPAAAQGSWPEGVSC